MFNAQPTGTVISRQDRQKETKAKEKEEVQKNTDRLGKKHTQKGRK